MRTHIKNLRHKFNKQRDLYALSGSLCLLLLATLQPTIPLKYNIYSYLMVLDITQSMNTADITVNGKSISRLEHSKQLLRETISSMPCGTKVGIGMFSGVNVVALYVPIEVCSNFSSLQETLDHIDWRSAWTADSRIRDGLLSSAQVINNFAEPAQLVYFTDGEEAPKLHTFNTRDLSTFQGASGWLIVGVGTETGGAIPKLDSKNQLIGYWSHESMQLTPGAAPIAAAGILQRKSDLADSPQDRYISKLAEGYLKNTSKEIGASYVRGDNLQNLLNALKKQKPSRRDVSAYSLDWIFAMFAALLLLSAYIRNVSFKSLRYYFTHLHSTNNKLNTNKETAIAHDNHFQ